MSLFSCVNKHKLTQHDQWRDSLFVAGRVCGIFTDISSLVSHLHIFDLNGWVVQSGWVCYKTNTPWQRGFGGIICPKLWMENCDVVPLSASWFKDPRHLYARGNKFRRWPTAHKRLQKVLLTKSCSLGSTALLKTGRKHGSCFLTWVSWFSPGFGNWQRSVTVWPGYDTTSGSTLTRSANDPGKRTRKGHENRKQPSLVSD